MHGKDAESSTADNNSREYESNIFSKHKPNM
jgi:hypothetical protein